MRFTQTFNGMKIRSFLLIINILVFFTPGIGQNSVQTAIKTFAESPEFINAGISFMAIDLSTGESIAELNPKLAIPSASTAKLFSTASAIEILGPDYRAQTRIYCDGKIEKDGTLIGNLWIRGGGDATLGSKYFNKEGEEKAFLLNWADTLKKMGITHISGAVIADGSEFGYMGIPDGWSWNDMGNYYGAGPSGICIFDNMLKFSFKTGNVAGSKAELKSMFPTVQNMAFHNYVSAENVSGDNSYIFGGPYSLDRFATGSLPLNQSNFEVKGSLPDPEFQLADELTKQLEKIGVSVKEGAKSVRQLDLQLKNRYQSTDFKLLLSHKGQKISDIASITNLKSINLFAEQLVCLVGYKLASYGSTEEGLKQIEKYWAQKINLSGLYLKDGSGLSRTNAISASHFCQLLKVMSSSKNHQIFFSTLPVAGKSGTLSSLCKDQPGQGRIVAKSGTMSRIKSYAGYVNSKSGKHIAFAIIVTNFNNSSSSVTEKMERLLNTLAVY